MKTADVIVIGGGPAGSTCAWRLKAAGAKVIVIDAAEFPRDKVCAGWITPGVIAALEFNSALYSQTHTFQPLLGFRVGRVGRDDAVSVEYDAVVGAAIRRCEFDAYLLVRSGAELVTAMPVHSLRRAAGRWVVNDRWTAPMVVGAGGYGCPVARRLNGPMPHDVPLVVAREVEFPLDDRGKHACAVRGPVAEIYFTNDLKGYGWCVRKGDVMNVGLGRLDRRLTVPEVAAFANFVREARGVDTPAVERWSGHAYLVGVPRRQRRTGDGVVLIGDAAGLASDRSGEGIGPAVESGLMAAAVIADATGEFAQQRLARYDALVAERWPRSRVSSLAARLMPPGMGRAVASSLLQSPSFVGGVVLNRWFLHANQPFRVAA